MQDLELAIYAASAGAAVVREGFGDFGTPELKSFNNPVTEVDRAAEDVILGHLRRHRPDDAILAEESGSTAGGGRRWIVDPLDGTVNFVHGIPHIAVAVALFDGDEPLVGVIVDPLRNEVFSAEAGRGARLNGESVRVTAAPTLTGTVIATGFAYDHHDHAAAYTRTVTAVLEQVNGIRRMGAAALDLAWVAAGRYDGYWEYSLAPWDLAAGILLVREAGGIASTPLGGPARPEVPHIVASNAMIHEQLRAIVAATIPPHFEPIEDR
jgi:myo-inositol-1(or 4)-monophosphatase